MRKLKNGISSFGLHILAMLLPRQEWLTCIGRIAFPIFAFMIVEGITRTHDRKQYLKRLLIFALISEIPFDLMYGTVPFYPYHQNVLWTFLLAVLMILMIEKAKAVGKRWLTVSACAGAVLLGAILGTVTMADYYAVGVLTVLVFYFFRQRTWWCALGQLVCLYYLNVEILGGYYYDIELFGHSFELVQQSLALLALIPIWLYRGRQGYHKKWFQYFCYAFYPAHMLVLYAAYRLVAGGGR